MKILGSALWTDPTLATEPTLTGAWFAAPPAGAWGAFVQRYRANFGTDPPRLASLAYDAVNMATALAEANALNDVGITRPEGFPGIDGTFRFRADGQVERNLDIIEVQPTGLRRQGPGAHDLPAAAGVVAAFTTSSRAGWRMADSPRRAAAVILIAAIVAADGSRACRAARAWPCHARRGPNFVGKWELLDPWVNGENWKSTKSPAVATAWPSSIVASTWTGKAIEENARGSPQPLSPGMFFT